MTTLKKLAALTDWRMLSEEVQKDRRRNKRVTLTFPVEVTGFDANGRLFCERTITQDISATGCRILLKRLVSRDDVLAIRLLGHKQEGVEPGSLLLFHVVWVTREDKEWMVGAEMLQQKKFWHVQFPEKKNPPNPHN